MKELTQFRSSAPTSSARDCAAFTLPEILIATTLFMLLLGGIVGANLFGMRMFQMTETRLRAGDGARKALGVISDEIRKSRTTWVGNVTNGVFVSLLNGEPQMGSALMLQPTTNATNFVIFFLNPSDQSFRRSVTETATTVILASGVTNTAIFQAQDYLGNVVTNSQNNRVIHATLEFLQSQPWLPVGDYSKLETSVTRRTLQ